MRACDGAAHQKEIVFCQYLHYTQILYGYLSVSIVARKAFAFLYAAWVGGATNGTGLTLAVTAILSAGNTIYSATPAAKNSNPTQAASFSIWKMPPCMATT